MNLHPLGQTRTFVKRDHAIIGTDSHVRSAIFGWESTEGVVLISPAMRAPGFVMYLASLDSLSKSTGAASGVQRFVYVLDGEVVLGQGDEAVKLRSEGYAYLPADCDLQIGSGSQAELLVFEKPYVKLPDVDTPSFRHGHVDDVAAEPFLGDPDARLACLLPDEPGFDMAVNVFTYQSGAALPFVETHVMEHGLYMTAGQGVYRLNESWYPVAEGDSIWMGAYCPQWFVAMGGQPAQYIYYKDINRSPFD
ncbi:MAG: (S)-ureidoglycine aminohydrolase [Planctomycetota bacterium]